ncbi:MAG: HlyD family efflux transporter periplasmic adaptor subunit [Gammaproteobacteria bacterium]|nr:HlyD family efflux transporter periplasmic adaptor subunit [Gammaproteobacteria bacterium]
MNNKKNIAREAASQRRHYRLLAPLKVSLDGQEYTTQNWSVGGLSIHDYSGVAERFDELDAQIAVTFGQRKIYFNTRIRVSRYDADMRKIAVEFFSLQKKHETLLKYFSDALIQGKMVSSDGIIQHINNLPVTPVSEKPDLPPDGSIPPRRRSVKTWMISAIYLLLGLFLSYYMINTVYTNIFKLRVDMATITGSDRVIKSPVSGIIDKIYVNTGDHVSSNDPLFYVRNEETLEQLEMAKIEIQNVQIDLNEKEQQLKSEQKKLESYRKFSTHKLQIAKVKTTGLQETLRITEKRQKRISQLYADGTVSEENLDTIAEQLVQLRAELDVAIAEQKIAGWVIKETHNGHYFTDKVLVGEVDELKTAVTAAHQRVTLEEERLKILESRLQRLVIHAPVDGKILSLYPNTHQLITKGEALLLIEQSDGNRGVEAFISVQEMENVVLNQSAKIIINNKKLALDAKVTGIERMSREDDMLGFVRVKLEFSEDNTQESIAALPSGLPVTVEFSRGAVSEYFFVANNR